jgi:hypothetical protein
VGGGCRAVLLNVNEPETWGVALAFMTVLDDLGKGLGPFLVSQFIAVWGRCALTTLTPPRSLSSMVLRL